ncbi:MAG: sulfotransferase family 2 domain-containing protein [Halothece sp. Uz-M2-17]|nr:sulfotransferase family 2 domain-containing protein [Halothece sp. Uz-M2-17]
MKSSLDRSKINATIKQSKFHRYIYLNNPKSACSTIQYNLWMNDYRAGNVDFLPSEGLELHQKAIGNVFTKNWNIDQPQEWFIFSFVRNPFVRLLSVYLDKVNKQTPIKKELTQIIGIDFQASISFDEFIEMISELSPQEDNPHWREQSENILIGYLPINYLGYVEYLESDLTTVWKRIFRKPNFETIKSWQSHKTGAKELLEKYYTSRSKHLAYLKYEKDFINFGYSENFNYLEPQKITRTFPIHSKDNA